MFLQLNSTNLFLIFVYVNVFCRAIELEKGRLLYLILNIIGAIALGLKVYKDKCNIKELITIVILFIIGVISFIVTKKFTLMLTCLCICGSKNIDIDRLFRGMYKIRIIAFIGMILAAIVSITEDRIIIMHRNGLEEIRHSLGFSHPNMTHLVLFILIAIYIYINYEKLDVKNYIIIMLINISIYFLTISRTGMIGILLLCLLCFISKLQIKELNIFINKFLCKLPRYLYIILVSFSFITAWFFRKWPWLKILDKLFTGRFYLSNKILTEFGFSLFGNQNVGMLDNGYIYLYVQFGLIGFILVSWLILNVCKYIEETSNTKLAILQIGFLFYLFTECFISNIFMHVTLFFAAKCIFKEKEYTRHTLTLDSYKVKLR